MAGLARRDGFNQQERIILVINLGQPFAKIAGAAIIGRKKPDNRPVNQRLVQQLVDIGLPDFKVALRVQQQMLVTAAKGAVLGYKRRCRWHDLHQSGGAGTAFRARVKA